MALAASVLGSARGFIDAWIEQTTPRKLARGLRAADDALTHRRLAEATWYVDITLSKLRADAAELWQMAEARAPVSMQQRAQIRWNMCRGCDLVVAPSSTCCGLPVAARSFSITRCSAASWHVIGGLGHAVLVPDPLAQFVGGSLLGSNKLEMVL